MASAAGNDAPLLDVLATLCYNSRVNKWLALSILWLLGSLFLAGGIAAQEQDPLQVLLALLNQARLDQGLPPYELSEQLSSSAQRHADDMAAHDLDSSTGSDGSTIRQRTAEAGYVAWDSGRMVAESFWVGSGSAQAALEWLLTDPVQQENILGSSFREIGIGYAVAGGGNACFVLDLGARPNVLPVFIDDDAETAESPVVAIHLTNEEAYPQGEGTLQMGRALEVRISNTPNFDASPWQTWEPLVAWTLAPEPGEQTVYVQFRDGAGRQAAATDSIVLLAAEGEDAVPTPAAPATMAAPTPAAMATASPATAPAVPSPGDTTGAPTTVPVTAVPSAGAVASASTSWTPQPSASASSSGAPGSPLPLLCVLQVVALLLGAALALRRGQS